MIRALQAKGVFLCHCRQEGETLQVGLMALEQPGQRSVVVFDRDDESHQLTVELPAGEAIALCDVELRILEHEHSQTPGRAERCRRPAAA
ncbi:MAG: hypothetical protein ACR2FS_15265 [Phormidesmis sp.]